MLSIGLWSRSGAPWPARAVSRPGRRCARSRSGLRGSEIRLAWSIYETNDLAGAISLLRATIGRLDGMPPSPEAAACLASLATFMLYAGRYRDAVPIAERAIAVSEAAGARGRQVEAMGALGASLAVLGDCERGLAVLRQALEIAKQLADTRRSRWRYLGLAEHAQRLR